MTGAWATVLPTLITVVLGGGLVAGYVSLRRLSGQRRIDAAQRDSLISEAAGRVVQMTAESLQHCQTECAQLRERLDAAELRAGRLERRVVQLEGAMRRAGVAVPAAPAGRGRGG